MSNNQNWSATGEQLKDALTEANGKLKIAMKAFRTPMLLLRPMFRYGSRERRKESVKIS